ncbi:MAG: hypothetical protein DME25_01625, partial [Verrucomicrobia bacterium]
DFSIVNATIDPGILTSTSPMPTNLDGAAGAGETDFFLSYFVPFADVVSALQTVGVSGVTTNSYFRYVIASSTQPNSLNQDLNGLNGGINSTTGFTNFSSPPITPTGLTNRPPVAADDIASTPEDSPAT